ncbi:The ARFlike 2 binding protein BART [Leishmania braziliensis]|nr:The ARFlike 2 binding protein BART [Leishmania braziliensis]
MTESRWITEALVQFSASPVWLTPIDNFLDGNCCIFRNESEMQLEYTIVHNKFKELVDSLLTSFLTELGVPMGAAVEALQSSLASSKETSDSRSERQAANKLLKQILNADNFSYFYTMMVKRNLELDILASAALCSQGVCVDGGAAPAAEMGDSKTSAPAHVQRAIDANGGADEEDALRRAIEVSLHDSAAQEQLRAYHEACVQEDVNMQAAAIERQANSAKARLDTVLQAQAAQDLSNVEHYRQDHMDLIGKQKELQTEQFCNYSMAGRGPNVNGETELSKADFSSPEAPQAIPAPSATAAVTLVSTAAHLPVTASSSPPALPSVGQRQDALPAILSKAATSTSQPAISAPARQAHGTAFSATPVPTPAPTREELDKRAEYMREQREKILARNRASRQEQLNTFLQNNSSSTTTSFSAAGAAAGAEQSVTVEVARRLRGDLIGEGRKNSS